MMNSSPVLKRGYYANGGNDNADADAYDSSTVEEEEEEAEDTSGLLPTKKRPRLDNDQHKQTEGLAPSRIASSYDGSLGTITDGVQEHFGDDLFVFLAHVHQHVNQSPEFTIKSYAAHWNLPRTTLGRLARTLRQGEEYHDPDLGKQWHGIIQQFWQNQKRQSHQIKDPPPASRTNVLATTAKDTIRKSKANLDETNNNDNIGNHENHRFLDNTPETATSALEKLIWRRFQGDTFVFLQDLYQNMIQQTNGEIKNYRCIPYCQLYKLPTQRSTLHRIVAEIKGEARDGSLGKLWLARLQAFETWRHSNHDKCLKTTPVVAAVHPTPKPTTTTTTTTTTTNHAEAYPNRLFARASRGSINPSNHAKTKQEEEFTQYRSSDNSLSNNNDTSNHENNHDDSILPPPSPERATETTLVTPPTATRTRTTVARQSQVEPTDLYAPLDNETRVRRRCRDTMVSNHYDCNNDDEDNNNDNVSGDSDASVGSMLVSWKVAVGMGVLVFFAFWGPVALVLTLWNRSAAGLTTSQGCCWAT